MENETTFFGAYAQMWSGIFDYSGVSNRKQYWYPFILHVVVALLAAGLLFCSLLVEKGGLFFSLAAFVLIGYLTLSILPWIALTIRRLRDSGRSGWWTLLALVLGVGMIALLILCTSASTIYHIGNGDFNPVNNEIECVYGPPEMFDPAQNELEEVYGPPEMLDPSAAPEEEPDEDFNANENLPEPIYGPPEMMEQE